MRDKITVMGIRARGRHGVLAVEREIGQPFVVDVEMIVDTARAGQTDDLTDTVDYATVAMVVVQVITGPPFRLIEALAAHIATSVKAFPGVEQVTVTVHKPFAPVPELFEDVMIRITR